MAGRLSELAIRARRLITPAGRTPRTTAGVQLTARRQVGGGVTRFSFRLAFAIDLAYVGMGALGGAAVARAATLARPPSIAPSTSATVACPPCVGARETCVHPDPVAPCFRVHSSSCK